jgi:hypothetical protein
MGNEPTIDQMNEAIALFDGWEFHKGDPDHKCNFCFAGDEPCTPAVDRFIKNGRTMFHYNLKYNYSWDLLMPVGKKIYDLLAVMMRQRPAHTTCHGDILEVDICCAIREYNIEKAHEAICQFIVWYNNQNKNQ